MEMVPFSYPRISPEAITALQSLGIEVKREKAGFTFEVSRSECHWHSDDNGGSYDLQIRGQSFWLDCNGNRGLELQ